MDLDRELDEDLATGFAEPVSSSLLKTIRFPAGPYGAPHLPAIANMLLTLMITVCLMSITWLWFWLYIPVGVGLHFLMWWVTKDDPHRVAVWIRSLRFPKFLSAR